jgi:hypothetical protein
LFSNGSKIAEDNANLFWDNMNKRLGIGTTSPAEKLHVVGNFSLQGSLNMNGGENEICNIKQIRGRFSDKLLRLDSGPSGSTGSILFNYDTTTTVIFYNGSGVEIMRIQPDGNVGIGTTSPAEKLDVVGNVIIDNDTYMLLGNSTIYNPYAFLHLRRRNVGDRGTLLLENYGQCTAWITPDPDALAFVVEYSKGFKWRNGVAYNGDPSGGTTVMSLDGSGNLNVSGYGNLGSLRIGGTEIISSDRYLYNLTGASISGTLNMMGNVIRSSVKALDDPHSGSIGEFQNDLAYAVEKGFTVTASTPPTSGSLSAMFNPNSIECAVWSTSVTLPITIQVDLPFQVHYRKVIAINFPWDNSTSGVKVELYDDSVPGWVTVYDNSSFSGTSVVFSTYRNYVSKIRFTFYGSYNTTNGLYISRLIMASDHYSGRNDTSYFLERGGGSMHGNILPKPDNSFDLGSTSYRWRDIYLAKASGSILFSDGSKVTEDNANLFWDNTNKRLGIRTTGPASPLHVKGTDHQLLTLERSVNAVGYGAGWHARLLDSASNVHDYAAIYGIIQANTDGAEKGALVFYTANPSLAEKMRITAEGNVGIGTISPAEKLDVVGNIKASGYANVGSLQIGGTEVINSSRNIVGLGIDQATYIFNANGENRHIIWWTPTDPFKALDFYNYRSIWGENTYEMVFRTAPSGGGFTSRLRIGGGADVVDVKVENAYLNITNQGLKIGGVEVIGSDRRLINILNQASFNVSPDQGAFRIYREGVEIFRAGYHSYSIWFKAFNPYDGWIWRNDTDTSTLMFLGTDGHLDLASYLNSSSLRIGGTEIVDSVRNLKNVFADAGIITSGTFDVARIPNLDASKITSGRFTVSRLPDGTSGYVLVGQGSGYDLAWRDISGIAGVITDSQHGTKTSIPFAHHGDWGHYGKIPTSAPSGAAERAYVDSANLYVHDGTSWVLRATKDWNSLINKPSTFPPSAHASTHEYGGSDLVRNLDYLAIRGTTVIDSSRNLSNIVNATISGGTVTITPSGASYPWIFTYDGSDPCLRSNTGNWGKLGTSTYYLYWIYSNVAYHDFVYPKSGNNTGRIGDSSLYWYAIYVTTVNASKLYGTVGLPQPLKRPLKGLEDLKMVQFREDGLPLEKTLPTHIANEIDEVKERVRREKIEIKKMKERETKSLELTEEDEKEIEDTVNKIVDSDTINICHTIGWLIQCIKQLTDKVEQLENKIKVLESNKPSGIVKK